MTRGARGSNGGRWAASVGTAKGSRPEGDTRPSSTSARAWPPSWPGYQSSRIAGTSRRQDSPRIAPPPISTTTVRGLAATTALMRSSSCGSSRRSVRSPAAKSPPGRAEPKAVTAAITPATGAQNGCSRRRPNQRCNGSGGGTWLRIGAMSPGWMCSPSRRQSRPSTSTAASLRAARAAAAAGSWPSAWCSSRSGAAARNPSSGVTTDPGAGRVSEEPRSPRLATAAWAPINASERRPRRGSTSASLRSSTIDLVAASRARARWAGQPRSAAG